jgi:hypothetical protein
LRSCIARTGVLLLWIGIAVAAAAMYGIVNDQITATISPEYYSVYKHQQFAPALKQIGLTDAPTRVQALAVGVMATWWFGLFLGIMLGISSVVGRNAPLSTRRYVGAVMWVMSVTLGFSALFGVVAYAAEPLVRPTPDNWPFLEGITNTGRAFAVCWWHNGAYLGALAATVVASFGVQRQRTAG